MTILQRIASIFRRPDPLDPVDEFLDRLEAEVRRDQADAARNRAIDAAMDRVYRDPVKAQLAAMSETQRDRCLGRESHIPPITRKRMLTRIK